MIFAEPMELKIDGVRAEHTVLTGDAGAFEQGIAETFELGAGQGDIHVDRTILIHGDEWQVDIAGHTGRKFAFGFFSSFFQALQNLRIRAGQFTQSIYRQAVKYNLEYGQDCQENHGRSL